MLTTKLKLVFHFNTTTFTRFLYLLIVIITALVAFVSVIFFSSQAVRTAPNKDWTRNVNVIVVGAAYVLILVISLTFCLRRRLSVRLTLARIPKGRIATGKGDVPKVVHNFVEREFLRSCAIAFASLPKGSRREGWGAPGTKYKGVRFRTAILDTVGPIDAAARAVIPSIPPLSPHVPLARHLRHLLPLLSLSGMSATHNTYTSNIDMHVAAISDSNDDGSGEGGGDGPEVLFRHYTDAVELTKYSERELEEEEFEEAMEAAGVLKGILDAYKSALEEQHGQ